MTIEKATIADIAKLLLYGKTKEELTAWGSHPLALPSGAAPAARWETEVENSGLKWAYGLLYCI